MRVSSISSDLGGVLRRLLTPSSAASLFRLRFSTVLLCFLMLARRTSDSIPLRQASTRSSRRSSSPEYSDSEEEGSVGSDSRSEEGQSTASTSRGRIRKTLSTGKVSYSLLTPVQDRSPLHQQRQPRPSPSPSPEPSDESDASLSSYDSSAQKEDKPLKGRPYYWMSKRHSFRQIYLRWSFTLGTLCSTLTDLLIHPQR